MVYFEYTIVVLCILIISFDVIAIKNDFTKKVIVSKGTDIIIQLLVMILFIIAIIYDI